MRTLALHYLLNNGSSAVNGCRQNESPNVTIYTIPVHLLMYCEAKSCMFLKNKFIIICLQLQTIAVLVKIWALSLILLSPVKVILYESGEKYAQAKTILNKYVGWFWCAIQHFSLEKALSWITELYFGQKQKSLKLNALRMDFFSYKLTAYWGTGLLWCF